MQATAGNAAVQRYLQREVRGRPVVQRDPVETEAGADVPAREAVGDGVLRYGSRGDDVRTLQERLNQVGAGRPALAVDGVFGRRTQRAVRNFQRAHPPLAVDGDAGPETLPELERAVSGTGGTTETVTTAPTTVTGDGADAGTATPAPDTDREAARKLFDLGRVQYGAGDYARAYDDFSKAYEITGDPALLYNRANCLRVMGGRRLEAVALYEQFLATNADADEERKQARQHIEDLRGTGRSGDASLDKAMLNTYNRTAAELYGQGQYARADDEFAKAYDVSGDPAMLFNRAQSLRLVGGRRAEAIAMYERFSAEVASADAKAAAAEQIAQLRGPAKTADAATNKQNANDLFLEGQKRYAEGAYGPAYDLFSAAWEIDADPAMLYNRAQALRLLGGRRQEAIALYEQMLRLEIGDETSSLVRAWIAELRGPGPSAPTTGGGARAVGAPTPNLP